MAVFNIYTHQDKYINIIYKSSTLLELLNKVKRIYHFIYKVIKKRFKEKIRKKRFITGQ